MPANHREESGRKPARRKAATTARADKLKMYQRMQEVIALASGVDQPTRQELADRFGITPRAVSNIIADMKLYGVEITTRPRPKDLKQGYVVVGTDFLRQDMSISEAVASVLLTQSVLGTPLAADAPSAERGASRIAESLGKEVRQKLERLSGRFAVRLLRTAKPLRPEVFRVLLDAILENRVVSMEYESPYKEKGGAAGGTASEGPVDGAGPAAGVLGKARKVQTTLVEPYGVFFARRSWYLVARKRPGGEMRQYKIGRIKRIEPTGNTFDMPRNWNVDGYLRNAWETINSDRAPVRVVIDLSPKVAGNMLETTWHESQETKPLADGWVRFSARVAGVDELIWWVLSIGSHARVVEPKELRDRVHEEIRRMHAAL
jgi:predicted DNA-binding transcriptional regulator YafY